MSPAVKRLTDPEVVQALSQLGEWRIADGKLHREYAFRDFVEAWAFMSAAALLVQQMDHHPEWFNVYKTVEVTLSTHDAGGVTELDIKLATAMDRLVGS